MAKWSPSANSGAGSWSGFGTGLNNDILGLDIDLNENIYVGGYFTQAGGVTTKAIAKWNGTAWEAMAGGGAWGTVWIVQTNSQGDIYFAGGFTQTYSGMIRPNIFKYIPLIDQIY